MHEREAERLGLRYLYVPIDLDRLDLPTGYLAGMITYAQLLGFRGFNVTHPCKQAILEHLDEVASTAAEVGAVNTVVFRDGRSIGHNTDLYGFEQNLVRGLPRASLDKVVILGAGGAGSAVAHAVLGLDANRIVVIDMNEARLNQLEASLGKRFKSSRFSVAAPIDARVELIDATGLVNATPMGMGAHPGMPLSGDILRPDLWVADIVYLPLETELLRTARDIGCQTLDGGRMAVFQAAAAFELFTGQQPDSDRMQRHFAELTAKRDAAQT
jgi:shikimate dehydrogenase